MSNVAETPTKHECDAAETLTESDYTNAILAQRACNLSGIVHSLSRVMPRIRATLEKELGDKFSTDDVDKHPICRLYAEQIIHLSGGGMGDHGSYHGAYAAVEQKEKEFIAARAAAIPEEDKI